MELYEDRLIRAVCYKDYHDAKIQTEKILDMIKMRQKGFDYFKNYLFEFNGIFYWNIHKDLKDDKARKENLNTRNYYTSEIAKSENIHDLEKIFHQMIKYYSTTYDRIIKDCLDPVVREILIYIHHNSDKKISLMVLSDKFNISKSYLSVLLSNNTKMSLPELIRYFRMKKAITFLKNSSYSIEDIAKKVGYTSCSYFCSQFKDVYQLTPMNYRHIYDHQRY
ncbi:MAG: helix-turn-helix domain-containing protein [Tissierellia bacterium]|nr:helix-turn-helix domain-containing protein [Tissierellia bacterium]